MKKTWSNEKTSETKCVENLTKENCKENCQKPNVKKTLQIEHLSVIEVPIVDISAAAGGGAFNSDYMDSCGTLPVPYSMLSGSGERLCIKVSGKSMEPTLQDGSSVVIRHIERTEWMCLKDKAVCVVTDREGSTYIKRVENRLYHSGTMRFLSDNLDKRRFQTFELSEAEIHNLWLVELYISTAIPDMNAELYDRMDNMEDDMFEIKGMLKTLVKRS